MQVTFLPPIQASRLPRTILPPAADRAVPPAPVGTLYYLPDLSPRLAGAAQLRLGLAQPPRELLLAAPGSLRHSPKIEAAAEKAAIDLLRQATLMLARQPGVPASVAVAVPLVWSAYNARALYQRWQAGADIPTLALGVGGLMLDGWGKATGAGLLTGSAELTPGMAESFGLVLLTANAVKDGEDLSMALLDDKLASQSVLYKAVRCLEPVLEAALSDRPELAGVTLLPLPHLPPPQVPRLPAGD